jgi:hypothetical protein
VPPVVQAEPGRRARLVHGERHLGSLAHRRRLRGERGGQPRRVAEVPVPGLGGGHQPAGLRRALNGRPVHHPQPRVGEATRVPARAAPAVHGQRAEVCLPPAGRQFQRRVQRQQHRRGGHAGRMERRHVRTVQVHRDGGRRAGQGAHRVQHAGRRGHPVAAGQQVGAVAAGGADHDPGRRGCRQAAGGEQLRPGVELVTGRGHPGHRRGEVGVVHGAAIHAAGAGAVAVARIAAWAPADGSITGGRITGAEPQPARRGVHPGTGQPVPGARGHRPRRGREHLGRQLGIEHGHDRAARVKVTGSRLKPLSTLE